ncbi:effector-associated constant component EACC1 [Streptomyces chartreusis]|uniref:effector-associated constant component EACC1 n=1 Tax=Streptomyces chartreusis TaxID=1969 RepID=UPI0036DF7E34
MHVNRDRSLHGIGRAQWIPRSAREGELGTGLDILAIVVSSVVGVPSAIDTVSRWCRGTRQSVEITVGAKSIKVTGTESPEEIEVLAEALKVAVRPPDGSP